MAGYDWQNGMSNNAVEAYDRGLVPASKVGRGIPAALVDQFCWYEEWHHASAHFNKVKFYDRERALATFGLIEHDDFKADEAAVAALAAYKAEKKSGPKIEIHENCRVEWIEWGGSIRRPKAYHQVEEGARVELKGSTATITLKSGKVFKKRLGTSGFNFVPVTSADHASNS